MHSFFKYVLMLSLCIAGVFFTALPTYAAKEDKTLFSLDCFSHEQMPFQSICFDQKEEKALFSYTLDLTATHSSKGSTTASASGPVLNALLLFNLVNEYRKKINLPAFKTDDNLCKIAESRLPELAEEIHGWKAMHQGFYERPISQMGAENLISFNTEEDALTWWLNSYIHRISIQGDYQYSCVACIGNNCTQIFTNVPPRKSSS